MIRKRSMPQVCMCRSGSMLSYFHACASMEWGHVKVESGCRVIFESCAVCLTASLAAASASACQAGPWGLGGSTPGLGGSMVSAKLPTPAKYQVRHTET